MPCVPLERSSDGSGQGRCYGVVVGIAASVRDMSRVLYHLALAQLLWIGYTVYGPEYAPKGSAANVAGGDGAAASSLGGQLRSGLQLLSALVILAVLLMPRFRPRLVQSAMSALTRSLPSASGLKMYAKEAWEVLAHADWTDDPCMGEVPAPAKSAEDVQGAEGAVNRCLPIASGLKTYSKKAQSVAKEAWEVLAHADWNDDPCMGEVPAPAKSAEDVRDAMSAVKRSLPTALGLKTYAESAQSVAKEAWEVLAHTDWNDDPCMVDVPAPTRSVENVAATTGSATSVAAPTKSLAKEAWDGEDDVFSDTDSLDDAVPSPDCEGQILPRQTTV